MSLEVAVFILCYGGTVKEEMFSLSIHTFNLQKREIGLALSVDWKW